MVTYHNFCAMDWFRPALGEPTAPQLHCENAWSVPPDTSSRMRSEGGLPQHIVKDEAQGRGQEGRVRSRGRNPKQGLPKQHSQL